MRTLSGHAKTALLPVDCAASPLRQAVGDEVRYVACGRRVWLVNLFAPRRYTQRALFGIVQPRPLRRAVGSSRQGHAHLHGGCDPLQRVQTCLPARPTIYFAVREGSHPLVPRKVFLYQPTGIVRFGRGGSSKSTLHMTEECAFEEFARDRDAIHGDERAFATLAEIMYGTCNQFLTCAGLASNENRGVHGGDHLDLPRDLLKSWTLTEDLSELETLLHLLVQVFIFAFELAPRPFHLLECTGIGNSDRSLIREQSQPCEFALRERFTSEDPNDS
jgi:hypothetical protein